jgi:uncharacterized protein YwqG
LATQLLPALKDKPSIVDSKANSENDLYDKLGGWAEWISLNPICPICQQPMTNFIYQMGSETNIDYIWMDCGNAYIFQCPQHFEVVTAIIQG